VTEPVIRHAGLIALRLGGFWRGVLVEGPAGAGKSDLALRALDQGFSLVADDRVLLWTAQGRLFGRAPDTLAGLLEVRALDVIRLGALPFAEVALIARCGAAERVPEPRAEALLGVVTPVIDIDPREPSAPAKLSRALSHFDAAHKRRI
jgi:serine kinase of HPr protein (carbohydrate metabolism regulator)